MPDEHGQLRREIVERLRLLHLLLLAAALAWLLGGITVLTLWAWTSSIELTQLSALLVSLVVAFIATNYQANQMTMEQAALYLKEKYETETAGWEKDYKTRRQAYELVSFMKVLPLVLGAIIPIVILVASWGTAGVVATSAAVLVAIYLLIFFNFRYKL